MPPPTPTPPAPRLRHAFAFVWVTVLLDMIGIGLVMPVVPTLLHELTGKNVADASVYGGLLFFSYALMQFICSPISGALSDAVGRRPVLLLSVLGLGVDHTLTAFSPTIAWLFAGRLLAGVFGGSYATANAYIADVTPPAERGKAFGMMGAAFGVGFIVGPALGGLLGGFGGRVPFFVAAGLSFANVLYGAIVLPETHPKERRTPFAFRQASPLGALFRIPGGGAVRTLAAALFIVYLAQTIYPSIWSFYSASRYDWAPRTIGISLATYGVVNTAVQALLVGKAIARWGERRAAVLALAVDALTLVGFALATHGWMIFVIIVASAPAGVAMPALTAIMSTSAPAEEQGRLQGAVGSLEGLSSIVGPLIMTQLFSAFRTSVPGAPFFLSAALVLGALTVLARSHPRPAAAGRAALGP